MDAFDAFADPALVLPVRGQAVRIEPPTAWDALRIRRRLMGLSGARLSAIDEHDTIVQLLGADHYRELAEQWPESILLHIGRTALMHFCGSDELAVKVWHLGLDDTPDPGEVLDESAPGYLHPDDPGGGPIIDAAAGIREWFNPPAKKTAAAANVRLDLSWRDVFACWGEVELDMHERYGVDLHSGILHTRPWPWLEARIRDLAMTPGSRLNRAILAPLRQN